MITLKTFTIRTRARRDILVQCHQIFDSINAMRHESDAIGLGLKCTVVSAMPGDLQDEDDQGTMAGTRGTCEFDVIGSSR
jgi:hypothetical protein